MYRGQVPAQTTVNYPGVAGTTNCGPGTCQQTVVQYVPQTAFRTVWASVPVTSYRTTTSYNPATGLPITCTRPCTSHTWQARRVPYTTYRPVYSTVPVTTAGLCGTTSYSPGIASTTVPGYTPGTAVTTALPPAPAGSCNGCSVPAPSAFAAPSVSAPAFSAPSATSPAYSAPSAVPYSPAPYPSASPAPYPSASPAPYPSASPAPYPSTGPSAVAPVPADQPPSLTPGALQPVPQSSMPSGALRPSQSSGYGGSAPLPGHSYINEAGSQQGGSPPTDSRLRPLPDLDRQPMDLDADGVPRLLNPRDQTAARPIRHAWSNPISWPKGKSIRTAVAVETDHVAPPVGQWDDSGWRSASF